MKKWFSDAEGYGLISRKNGMDVSVYFSAFRRGGVAFEVAKGPQG
jgi:cold shock CspA family protein